MSTRRIVTRKPAAATAEEPTTLSPASSSRKTTRRAAKAEPQKDEYLEGIAARGKAQEGSAAPASRVEASSQPTVPEDLGIVTAAECANAYHALMNVVSPSDYSFSEHLKMMFNKLAREKGLA